MRDNFCAGSEVEPPWIAEVGSSRISEWTLAIRDSFRSGFAKAWLRMNTRPDEKVITTVDNQLYYLSALSVNSWFDTTYLTQEEFETWSTERIIGTLTSNGIKYILDDRFNNSRTHYSYWIDTWIQQHPQALVFQAQNQRVIDLSRF